MTDTQETETPAAAAAEKKAPLEIIRGRIPVALVAAIRFGDHATDTVAEIARKFGTTAGKITDIRKGNSFQYVTETFVPSQSQYDQAVEFIKKHPRYEEDTVDTVIVELDAMGIATDEQSKDFEMARVAARGQSTKTKAGEDANAGGGNRRGAGAAPSDGTEADNLLA